jgi:hypothetical protein
MLEVLESIADNRAVQLVSLVMAVGASRYGWTVARRYFWRP